MTEKKYPEAPGAVVITPNGSYWVHEHPKEIEEKLDDTSYSDFCHLAGLESSTEELGRLDAYNLKLRPQWVMGIRGMSQRSFENMLKQHEPEEQPGPTVRGGGFVVALGGEEMQAFFGEMEVEEDDVCIHNYCQHTAKEHLEMYGPCMVDDCPCGHFHPEDPEEKEPDG